MSKLTLIIGNKNYSSWSLRPWIFMKQSQIAFSEKRIPLFTDTTDQKLSPYYSNYKVPVLLDGDFIVWDSLAIMEYLSENYLDSKGWPSEARAKAFARSISAEMHSSFFAVRNELPMNCRKKFDNFKIPSDVQKDILRIKDIWRKCKTEYGTQGNWLFGEYSIADAMYAPVVLRFVGYDVPLDGLEKTYVQYVIDQPYIKEWIEAGIEEKEIIELDEI